MDAPQTPDGRVLPDLDELVHTYGRAVYRVAVSIVQDPAMAEDVAQDTFVAAWRSADSFRGSGSPRSWLLRIAHNAAVSRLRRERDEARPPERMPDVRDPHDVERVVMGRQGLEDVAAAFGDLDALTRSIIVLREVEHLTYEEIADVLELSLPTVKTRLLRGRRSLRQQAEAVT